MTRRGRQSLTVRIGINGFGRMVRTFVRRALDRGDIDVVAVSDITDARTLQHRPACVP